MNIRLDVAIRDITGKSGLAIIEAILAGNRDPQELASLVDIRMKKSKEEIAQSLKGWWRAEDEFEKWEGLGLSIFYLPIYSPHLTIEILWWFVKYRWLNKVAYKTWSNLKKAVLALFRQYGTTYSIDFTELIIKNTTYIIKFNSA